MSALNGGDISKYDIILTRQPFGRAPDPSEIEQTAVQDIMTPQESFAKNLRMIAVTDDEFGLRAGIYDGKSKRSYFIEVGSMSEDGVKLLQADFDEGTAVLQKDSEVVTLHIDGKMQMGDAPPVSKARSLSGHTSMPSMNRSRTGGDGASRAMSYVDRLRMRRETMKKDEESRIDAAATLKLDSINKEQLLRQYNLEVIRAKGKKGSPLPIKLTPEEDARLVEEGVLPPRE